MLNRLKVPSVAIFPKGFERDSLGSNFWPREQDAGQNITLSPSIADHISVHCPVTPVTVLTANR